MLSVDVEDVDDLPVDQLVAEMHDTGNVQAAFECLAAGRGVVFALPHMGNYELTV